LSYNAHSAIPKPRRSSLYGDGLFDLLLASAKVDSTARRRWRARGVTVILARTATRTLLEKSDVITGLGEDGQLARPWSVTVFHAGTALDANGASSRRGRVLA